VAATLPDYDGRPFVRDLAAGLTVGALAIPSAMAYAELVGVPAVNGLYVLLLPLVAYAVFGSSRQVIIGPEAGVAAMLGTALAGMAVGPEELAPLAAAAALLTGAAFMLARILRLGWIADYFSRAVLVGYLHGIVVVVIAGQLGKLTGNPSGEQDPIPQIVHFVTHLGDTHGMTLAVGVAALVVVLTLRRVAPRLPAALIVVVIAIAVSYVMDLEERGVAVLDAIPSGMPSLQLPEVAAGDLVELLPIALGVFVVSFADSILTARSYAGRHNQHVDANQELFALGAANLTAGITTGFSPSASGSRTAVNDQLGARTQIAGMMSVLFVVVVLLFLTEPMAYLPSSVLAALIVSAAIGIVDVDAWRSLATAGRVSAVIAVITAVGVIAIGILPSLALAVVLSVVEIVARGSRPHDAVLGWVPRLARYADVRFHTDAEVEPGVLVYRLDDRLFFANVGYVVGRINEAIAGSPTEVRFVVFDAERVPDIDPTAIEALERLVGALGGRGIQLVLARSSRGVEEQLARTGIVDLIGAEHVHPTVRAAVAACRPQT
jgi:high affinity sulfate transporter 1